MDFRQHHLRLLPAVDKILQENILTEIKTAVPRSLVVEAVQDVITERRSFILEAPSQEELELLDISLPVLAEHALMKIQERMEASLQPVLNATGVIIHTNLGRAPLASSAVEAVKNIASNFSNLEISLKTGLRSSRYDHVEELLCRITGAEGALVVNNNAGAVFLALNTLAAGKEVIVSRGELVEIGGSFRLPEVMTSSSAILAEVGSTNRTYLRDYRGAINERTALLLKVHTSNFKVMGFTAAVNSRLLGELGKEYDIPVMDDQGSGVLVDLSKYGLPYEPRVQDAVTAGVDVVTFSGDKLLGGPQAGLIVGKKRYLEKIRKNQLTRALRVDKLTLAALESTLRLYLDEEKALKEIPVLRMLTVPTDILKQRAEILVREFQEKVGERCRIGISNEKARVGGGSMPMVSLPSFQVTLECSLIKPAVLAERLRWGRPPLFARVRNEKVLLDLRSLREEEDRLLIVTVVDVLRQENEVGIKK